MKSYLSLIDWNERLEQHGIRRVALYGAGKYGMAALKNIRKYIPGLDVVCFLDDDKERHFFEGGIEGVEIRLLQDAMKEKEPFHILITNYYVLSTLKKIEASGFDAQRALFWGELLIEDFPSDLTKQNRQDLKRVFDLLEDYQSKEIFRCMAEARITKNVDLLARTCQARQYFPEDIFTFGSEEVFVDGGAYDGDTIRHFLDAANGAYRHIYAFEPDQKNFLKLSQNTRDEKITCYNGGLWNETSEVGFMGNKGGSSQIEETGSGRIHVYRFDDLEIEYDATFIKMDIEGAELNALKGMEQTIRRCRPKLAVCIYHKFEDLWEIPLYIKELLPDCKLYIRNYTTYLDEIVLYAV